MIADPRAVAARWDQPRLRTIASLAVTVTEAPWTLSARDRGRGLDDETLLHLVALSAFFGHLNRIADVVEVPLDYLVRQTPPRIEPATPPLLAAPRVVDDAPALDLTSRPATAAALAAWRSELFERDTARLPHATRATLAAHVGHWLGANAAPTADAPPVLVELARVVTLAPWQLGDPALAPLRAQGWADAELFEAAAIASSATTFARIEVALRALSQAA